MASLLTYHQKKFLSKSFNSGQLICCSVVLVLNSIRCNGKFKKPHGGYLSLCKNNPTTKYDKRLSKSRLVNILIRNI